MISDQPIKAYYHNWSGAEIAEELLEGVFSVVRPLGINKICFAKLPFEKLYLSNDENCLVIGFGCTNFHSRFDTPPVATSTRSVLVQELCLSRDDSTKYRLYTADTMCQSPGIAIFPKFDFDVPSINLSDEPIAHVYYKNRINISLDLNSACWDGNTSLYQSFSNMVEKVLIEAAPYLKMSEEDFKKEVSIVNEKNLLKSICYTDAAEKQKLIKSILQAHEEITKHENRIAEFRRQLEYNEAALKNMRDISTSAARGFLTEIEKIKALRMVESVDAYSSIQQGIFSFITKKIYAKTQGRRYYFGQYRVSINLRNSTVSFYNLEESMRRKSAWGNQCHHPHVSGVGTACLGNVREDFRIAMQEKQYGYLAVLCLSFLSSVNIGDVAGEKVINWPLADENGNIIQDPAGSLLCCSSCNQRLPDDEPELQETCFQCAVCGAWHHKNCNRYHAIDDERFLCEDCFNLGAMRCSVCGEIKSGLEIHNNSITNKPICTSCSTSLIVARNSATMYEMESIFVASDPESEDHQRIAECQCCHRLFVKQSNEDTRCAYCNNEENSVVQCSVCGLYLPENRTLLYGTHHGDEIACTECASNYVVCNDLLFEQRRNCVLLEDGEYHYQEEGTENVSDQS